MKSFQMELRAVQAAGEDFEWYPTTHEIIAALKRDMARDIACNHSRRSNAVLDIGAGNGKVLSALADIEEIGKLYAIEKSHALIELMPKGVFILGCDFWHTSLIDKDVRHFTSGFRLTGSSFALLAPPVETEGAA